MTQKFNAHQLVFPGMEQPDKSEFYPAVVEILKAYPIRKKTLESLKIKKQIQDDQNIDEAIKYHEKWLMWIDNALDSLNDQERKIILRAYMDKDKPLDTKIMQEVNMRHTMYYETKDKAIRHIATVLGFI